MCAAVADADVAVVAAVFASAVAADDVVAATVVDSVTVDANAADIVGELLPVVELVLDVFV